MCDGSNCLLQQALVKVPLHLAGDATDRMKLLMPIYFLNEEGKFNFFNLSLNQSQLNSVKAVIGGFDLSSHNGS